MTSEFELIFMEDFCAAALRYDPFTQGDALNISCGNEQSWNDPRSHRFFLSAGGFRLVRVLFWCVGGADTSSALFGPKVAPRLTSLQVDLHKSASGAYLCLHSPHVWTFRNADLRSQSWKLTLGVWTRGGSISRCRVLTSYWSFLFSLWPSSVFSPVFLFHLLRRRGEKTE